MIGVEKALLWLRIMPGVSVQSQPSGIVKSIQFLINKCWLGMGNGWLARSQAGNHYCEIQVVDEIYDAPVRFIACLPRFPLPCQFAMC